MSWIITNSRKQLDLNNSTLHCIKWENWNIYLETNVDIISSSDSIKIISGNYYLIKSSNLEYTKKIDKLELDNVYDFLDGSYSVAIIKKNEILAASDIFNQKNIYYCRETECIYISDDIDTLRTTIALNCPYTININYLVSLIVNSNELIFHSPYNEINKLLPGFVMQFNNINKKIESKRYWYPQKDLDYYMNHSHTYFERSLDAVIGKYSDVVLCYSAGIDSSVLKEYYKQTKKVTLLHIKKDDLGDLCDPDYEYVIKESKEERLIVEAENYYLNYGCKKSYPNIYYYVNGYSLLYEKISNITGTRVFVDGNGGELAYNYFYKEYNNSNISYMVNCIVDAYKNENSFYCAYKEMILPYLKKDYIQVIQNRYVINYNTFINDELYALANQDYRTKVREYIGGVNNYHEMNLLLDIGYWWHLENDKGKDITFIYPYLSRNILFGNIAYLKKTTDVYSGREFQKKMCSSYLSENIKKRNNKGGGTINIINNLKKYKKEYLDLVEGSYLVKQNIIMFKKYVEAYENYINRVAFENVVGPICCSIWLSCDQ